MGYYGMNQDLTLLGKTTMMEWETMFITDLINLQISSLIWRISHLRGRQLKFSLFFKGFFKLKYSSFIILCQFLV